MSQYLTSQEIERAKRRAEELGDPWLAFIVRRMANELTELKDQNATARFLQGLEGY